jgi:uncharacterized protein YdcH (DUF465 family)
MKRLSAHELFKKARTVEAELSKLQTGRRLLSPVDRVRAAELKKQRLWVKDQLSELNVKTTGTLR